MQILTIAVLGACILALLLLVPLLVALVIDAVAPRPTPDARPPAGWHAARRRHPSGRDLPGGA